jgi:hypothetical protein
MIWGKKQGGRRQIYDIGAHDEENISLGYRDIRTSLERDGFK